MTLDHLDRTHAQDFHRRDYVDVTPLAQLCRELNAYFVRFDATRDAEAQVLGGETISRVYSWSAQLHAHHPTRQTLTDETQLKTIRYRWIAVFPVTGGNEGHYVHVDLLHQGDAEEWRTPVFMVKTFAGHAAAVTVAGELCRLLGV